MSRSKADLLKNRDTLTSAAGRAALFGTNEDHEYLVLDLDQICPKQDQPRRFFDEVKLQELASSIAKHGVLQPILVKETRLDTFEIIAGERRWRASRIAGKKQIPALVMKTDDEALVAVLENIQREDLDALETARGLAVLIDHYHATHEELGHIIGKSQTYVSRVLRILHLPEMVQNEYEKHRHVSISMLMEIASLDNEDAQLALWEKAKAGMSVAAARHEKKGRAGEVDLGAWLAMSSAKITKELTNLRTRGTPLDENQKESLRRLRSEIDALLSN